MSVRKIILVFTVILLLAGGAYAFPYDPNPSAIKTSVLTGNNGTTNTSTFTGDWGITFGSMSVNQLRVFNFMNNEFFSTGCGPGASLDLNIWMTPSFGEYKYQQQKDGWNRLLDTAAAVPATVGRGIVTDHDEMVEFLEKLPRGNLTLEYLGEIPQGFPFPFLVFCKDAPLGKDGKPDRSPEALESTGRPLVWVQGNIHGGEWSGGEGALAMAYDLAHGRYDEILSKVNVLITPRVCADGAKRPGRETRDLLALQWTTTPEARDLNRDNVLLDLPVTRAMRKMSRAYAPHFCIDLHERPASQISTPVSNTFGILADNDAHDIGASGTTIPHVPYDLVAIRYNVMEKDLKAMADRYGIHFGLYREDTDYFAHGTVNNYGMQMSSNSDVWPVELGSAPYGNANMTGSSRATWMINSTAFDPDAPYYLTSEAGYNTRSSRNINATFGIVSQLFENKSDYGGGGGRALWERRIAAGYICVLSALTTAAERGNVLVPQINAIRKSWVEKGKTVSANETIPILTIQPKPVYIKDREWTIIDISRDYNPGTAAQGGGRNLTNILRYDGTKALRKVADGTGFAGSNYVPAQGAGDRDHQFFKHEYTWMGGRGTDVVWNSPHTGEINIRGNENVRERIRPYAYIFEGEYADELAARMLMAGIEVKRLAADVTIDVEGWKYTRRPYIDSTSTTAAGWRNRHVDVYEIKNRKFEKDAYVVYLAQLPIHLIPIYMEPDLPWNVASCIFLPYMSLALGGGGGGSSGANLHEGLIGVEMPAYRYLKTVDLPTYDVDHYLPLINRGAVARFFNYHTQVEINNIAADTGDKHIKVFDYDIQVHSTDALIRDANAPMGKFDITLPTSKGNKSYKILVNDGTGTTYENLIPHSTMLGWDVATVNVARHGNVPFTVDLSGDKRPVVGDGSNRTVPRALPAVDSLIGVRIVEVVGSQIESIFKGGVLPPHYIEISTGLEYTKLIEEKGVLLSNSMLDGWHISALNLPQYSGSSKHKWTAYLVNGEVIIIIRESVYDRDLEVILTKDGTSETMNLNIMFSGEKEDWFGCNAGAAVLALLAVFPLFIRRKD